MFVLQRGYIFMLEKLQRLLNDINDWYNFRYQICRNLYFSHIWKIISVNISQRAEIWILNSKVSLFEVRHMVLIYWYVGQV